MVNDLALKKTNAIIVAAGNSSRMEFDKISAEIAGKSVLAHSIAPFQESNFISEITVVLRRDMVLNEHLMSQIKDYTKIVSICEGGSSRKESVHKGLKVT